MPSTSHSEVESYLLCRRKQYYGYGLRLRRINESASLAFGTAGHAILEAFYAEVLAVGGNSTEGQLAAFDIGLSKAREKFDEIIAEGYRDSDDKRWTLEKALFEHYFPNESFIRNGWRILAVEMEFNLRYDEEQDLKYPFKVDMIARDPEGKTAVIDHKFVWDFYTYEASELQPQIPKYIGALRALNHRIDYGAYNQIRTRRINGPKMNKAELVEAVSAAVTAAGGSVQSDYDKPIPKLVVAELELIAESYGISTSAGPEPEQLLNYLPLKPNSTRVQTTFMEQIEAARVIQELKELPLEEQDLLAVRVANKMVCQSCSFKDLCISDLNGANSALLIQTEFTVREKRAEFELTEELEEVS